MAKVSVRHNTDEDRDYAVFHCPGCGYSHRFLIGVRDSAGPWDDPKSWKNLTGLPNDAHNGWQWNGSADRPSFKPSLLLVGCDSESPNPVVRRCHSFVTDGQIHYCPDCEHELKGQVVDMLDC